MGLLDLPLGHKRQDDLYGNSSELIGDAEDSELFSEAFYVSLFESYVKQMRKEKDKVKQEPLQHQRVPMRLLRLMVLPLSRLLRSLPIVLGHLPHRHRQQYTRHKPHNRPLLENPSLSAHTRDEPNIERLIIIHVPQGIEPADHDEDGQGEEWG